MIRTWHIGPRAYPKSAFTGKGGLVAGGRWHHPGRPIIYTADSLSLAALEILAHVRSIDDVSDLIAQTTDIPDDLAQETATLASLSRHWYDAIPISLTQDIGDRWLQRARTAVLWVPSVHAAPQRNALLNPLLPDFRKIVRGKPILFRFDARISERLTLAIRDR